jgi:hypothetical protein
MAMILFLHNRPRAQSQRRLAEATGTRPELTGVCDVAAVTNNGGHNARHVRFEALETRDLACQCI